MFKVGSETVAHFSSVGIGAEHFESVSSTNDLARDKASNETEKVKVYVTETQTQGKGRGTNTWSDLGEGQQLLMTYSVAVERAPQHLTGPKIGLALFSAVTTSWPQLEWSLKAPNDLYLKDKKVAGLLVETVSQSDKHRLLIGLGLNVFSHPADIENANHLCSSDGLGDSLNADAWRTFLKLWHDLIGKKIDSGLGHQLSEAEQTQLLSALNANPAKAQTYLEVSPDGDLVTDEGRIPWSSI